MTNKGPTGPSPLLKTLVGVATTVAERKRDAEWEPLMTVDPRTLAARVGFAESWLGDPRAISLANEWRLGDGGPSPSLLDRLRDPELRLERYVRARAHLEPMGLPWAWLAAESVDHYYLECHAQVHHLDLKRVTAARYHGLLEEAQGGADPMPTLEPFKVGKSERPAVTLDRLRAWKAYGVAALEGWLASEAEAVPDSAASERPRADTLVRRRRGGRCYYLAKIRQPALAIVAIARQEFAASPSAESADLLKERRRDVYALLKEAEPLLTT